MSGPALREKLRAMVIGRVDLLAAAGYLKDVGVKMEVFSNGVRMSNAAAPEFKFTHIGEDALIGALRRVEAETRQPLPKNIEGDPNGG